MDCYRTFPKVKSNKSIIHTKYDFERFDIMYTTGCTESIVIDTLVVLAYH